MSGIMNDMIYVSKFLVNGVSVRNFGEAHELADKYKKCYGTEMKYFLDFLENKIQENMNNDDILDIYAEVPHLNVKKIKLNKENVSNLRTMKAKYFACFSGDKSNKESLRNRCNFALKSDGRINARFHTFDFRIQSNGNSGYLPPFYNGTKDEELEIFLGGEELNYDGVHNDEKKTLKIVFYRILKNSIFSCLTNYLIRGEKIEIDDNFFKRVDDYFITIKNGYEDQILKKNKHSVPAYNLINKIELICNNNPNKKIFYENSIIKIVNNMEKSKITKGGVSKSFLKIKKIAEINPQLAEEIVDIVLMGFENLFSDLNLINLHEFGPSLTVYISAYPVDVYMISRLIYNIIREDGLKSSSIIIISGAQHAKFYSYFFGKIKNMDIVKVYENEGDFMENCVEFEE